MTETEEARM